MLHGCVKHAVKLDIDAVLGFAGGLVVGVQTRHGFADPAKLTGVAQGDAGRVWHRQVHGPAGQFAVAQRASGGCVDDLARFGAQLAHRDLELFSAGLYQHRSGQRAEAAHGRVAHAHRHAAAGDAHAVFHHYIGIARRCAVDQEVGRVDVEFLTDDLCHGGEGALSAFHEGAEQAHFAVWAYFQKGRDLRTAFSGGRRRCLHARRAQRQAETEHQGADGRACEKASARQVDGFAVLQLEQFRGQIAGRVHQACSSWARAWTAAWMAL